MPGKMNKRDEHLWNKAKGVVTKQYPKVAEDSDQYWKLVQGVYQKMKGGKSMSDKIDMTKGKDTMLENYPLLKSRVKAHQRRTKTGNIVQVKEHQDSRQKKEPRIKKHAIGTHLGYYHPRVKDILNPIGHKKHRDAHLEAHEKQNKLAKKARAEGKHDLDLHHSAKSEWHKAQADAHDVMTNKRYHRGDMVMGEDKDKRHFAGWGYDRHKEILSDIRARITDKDKTKVGKIQQMMANEKKKQGEKTKE